MLHCSVYSAAERETIPERISSIVCNHLYLTGSSYVPGDVLHCHWILHIQSMTLTLHSGSVHKHAGISSQPSKCQSHMLIKAAYLAHCPGILELCQGPLLHCQDNCIFPTNCNLLRKSYGGAHYLGTLPVQQSILSSLPPGHILLEIDVHQGKILSRHCHTCCSSFNTTVFTTQHLLHHFWKFSRTRVDY